MKKHSGIPASEHKQHVGEFVLILPANLDAITLFKADSCNLLFYKMSPTH